MIAVLFPTLLTAVLASAATEVPHCTPQDRALRDPAATLFRSSRKALYDHAIATHREAQRLQDARAPASDAFADAADLYARYLALFPDDENAYELRWHQADALFHSLQFRAAADAYARIRDSVEGDDHRVDAAANVVSSLQKLVELGPMPTISTKRVEMSPLQRELIAACDMFVLIAPHDERTAGFRLTAGEVFFTHGHREEARTRLDSVVKLHPGSDAARIATAWLARL